MANQRNATQVLQARLDALVDARRAAHKQRLIARGIALWNRVEAEWAATHGQPPPPEKIN
jgi:hypothetical protein